MELDGLSDAERVAQVRSLFADLLHIPMEEIPDNHPEVIHFTSLSHSEKIQMLCDGMTQRQVGAYPPGGGALCISVV